MRTLTITLWAALVAALLALPGSAQIAPKGYQPLVHGIVSGTSYTANAGDFQNTISWKSAATAPKTTTMPGCNAGINGAWTGIVDGFGNAATYNITVNAVSGNVAGSTAGLLITSNQGGVVIQCDGAANNWLVRSQSANGANVRNVTITTDTILSSDNQGLVTYNSASPVAVTVPLGGSTGFPVSSFPFAVRNYGAGLVTLTPTSPSTILGGTFLQIASGQGALLWLDGAGNYQGIVIGLGNVNTTGGVTGQAATWTGPNSLNGSVPISNSGAANALVQADSGGHSPNSLLNFSIPLTIGWIAGQNPNNATVAILGQAGTITSITGVVETALGATGNTVSVYVAPSTTPCASGTLASTSFDPNGAAATNQTLTSGTPAVAPGSRICLHTTGSGWAAGAAIGGITVNFKPS